MVLQQHRDNPIWGKCTPGMQVEVKASWGQVATATANAEGYWRLLLPTPGAGGPSTLSITTVDTVITIEDVMVGEVWLAAGQSNMQLPMSGWPPYDTSAKTLSELADADFPDIRFLGVKDQFALIPADSFGGYWVPVRPDAIRDYSRVAYYFARQLHQELKVPIGIVQVSVGSTPIEAFMSQEALAQFPEYTDYLGALSQADVAEAWKEWENRWPARPIPQDPGGWSSWGLDPSVASDSLNHDSWPLMALPNSTEVQYPIDFNGAIWFRRNFVVGEVSTDAFLRIGAVDDMDWVYVNGQRVGATDSPGHHTERRTYTVPAGLLRKGSNVIALCAMDIGGNGRVDGPIALELGDGSVLDLQGNWHWQYAAEIENGYLRPFDAKVLSRDRMCTVSPSQFKPALLYQGMIYPLRDYGMAGVIFYQGESNLRASYMYRRQLTSLVRDWRKQWGRDLPFYYVQLAPFGICDKTVDNLMPYLWEAQRGALEGMAPAGMVSTLDNPHPHEIHPPDKEVVGERLAALALNRTYGYSRVDCGPIFKAAFMQEKMLIIQFEELGGGLEVRGDSLVGLEISTDGEQWQEVHPVVMQGYLEVSLQGEARPAWVRYAFCNAPVASLWNKEGFPAFPFLERIR